MGDVARTVYCIFILNVVVVWDHDNICQWLIIILFPGMATYIMLVTFVL